MATPVDDWSDELKAKIARAGWDVDEFAEGVRRRQAYLAEESESTVEASQTDADTAVEEDSWGRIKAEAADLE